MISSQSNQPNNKTLILVVTTVSAFSGAFIMSSINIALPVIGRQFSANAVLLGWLAIANILAAAVLLIPCGKLADTYGRTRFYIFGTLMQSATSFLAAFSPNIGWLITARVLQGMASSMTIVAYPAILISAYPSDERGKVLGINVAAVYTGVSLSPLLGGALTQQFGWPSIYIFTGVATLIIGIFLIWKLKGEKLEIKAQPFDFPGSIIFGLSLFGLIFGLSIIPGILGIWMIVAGVGGLGVFVFRELRAKYPMLDISLFRHNRLFTLSNITALISYCATFAVAFLVSLYLQYIKGFDPEIAGLLMVAQPAVQAVMSPIAGRLSDKIEPQYLASIGMAFTTVGLVILIFLNNSTPVAYVVLSLVTLGLGFGIFSSPNTNAIMGAVEQKQYSIANAVTGTFRGIGQMLSLAIVTLLFSVYIGPQEITVQYYPQFLHSTNVAFGIFTALCVAGIFISLARGKTHHR